MSRRSRSSSGSSGSRESDKSVSQYEVEFKPMGHKRLTQDLGGIVVPVSVTAVGGKSNYWDIKRLEPLLISLVNLSKGKEGPKPVKFFVADLLQWRSMVREAMHNTIRFLINIKNERGRPDGSGIDTSRAQLKVQYKKSTATPLRETKTGKILLIDKLFFSALMEALENKGSNEKIVTLADKHFERILKDPQIIEDFKYKARATGERWIEHLRRTLAHKNAARLNGLREITFGVDAGEACVRWDSVLPDNAASAAILRGVRDEYDSEADSKFKGIVDAAAHSFVEGVAKKIKSPELREVYSKHAFKLCRDYVLLESAAMKALGQKIPELIGVPKLSCAIAYPVSGGDVDAEKTPWGVWYKHMCERVSADETSVNLLPFNVEYKAKKLEANEADSVHKTLWGDRHRSYPCFSVQ